MTQIHQAMNIFPLTLSRSRRAFARWPTALWLLGAMSCMPAPPPNPVTALLPEPEPAEVDAVLILIGDAGAADGLGSPLLTYAAADVEHWSAELGRDSAVAVLYLGDNVYPNGVHHRSHRDFPRDSTRLMNQVAVVAGESARRWSTPAVFVAGNHDWGSTGGDRGLALLTNQARLLDQLRAEHGSNVRLAPDAGLGGPEVLDLGERARVLLIDSQWWLVEPDSAARQSVIDGLEAGISGAQQRHVVLAAHHPTATGGDHGRVSLWKGFVVRRLLQNMGARGQDLSSGRYRSFIGAQREAFGENAPPLAIVGGHDHSLQVLEGTVPGDPAWILVSGAGSKRTGVSDWPGMRFHSEGPGYMRMIFYKDGRVEVFVVEGGRDALRCPASDRDQAECIRRGATTFRPVFTGRLTSSSPSR